MNDQTLAQQLKALKEKKISAVELTRHYLDRIAKFNGDLNCYIHVTEDVALEQAKAADQAIAKGQTQALTGAVIAQKDIFCTKGIATTCGSHMLENFKAPFDATVVEKIHGQGAIMIGKTNMDEFAMGSSNENSYFGPAKNPWALDRIPGGSSGGSAAAVAAGLAVAATGTDTGGSIRQPASLCGITGIKPSYGRVSRYGMIAYASSLDQGGPMARTAEDCAILLKAMSGFDERDSTSADLPVPDYTASLNDSLSGLKIGIPKEFFGTGLDAQVAEVIQNALKTYEKLGAQLVEVSLPNMKLAIPAYYIIAPAECSSNLARYDGVRYGYRCQEPHNLDDLYKRSRGEGFGKEVKRRIMVGTYALSAGYYDAYYLKAQKIRRLVTEDYLNAFKQVDVIMGPAFPQTAFKLGEKSQDPVSIYLADIYTIGVNLAGLPGMSIPAGFAEALPVGLQLIGPHYSEARLLNIAHQYQQETDWHLQRPKNFE